MDAVALCRVVLVFPVMSLRQSESQSYLFRAHLKTAISMQCNALNSDTSREKWITISNFGGFFEWKKDNLLSWHHECIHHGSLRSFRGVHRPYLFTTWTWRHVRDPCVISGDDTPKPQAHNALQEATLPSGASKVFVKNTQKYKYKQYECF